MNVDSFIKAIEDVYLDEALEKLSKSPKDLVTIYLSAKEFQRAKLVRSNAMPAPEGEEDKRILININNGDSRDPDIRENTQQEQENHPA